MAHFNNTNGRSKSWPAASRRLRQEIFTACFSNPMAAFGRWVTMVTANLATAPINTTNQPEQIVASGVTAIAAGAYHSLFLKSDGSLWAMGCNIDGQLGDGTYYTAPTGLNKSLPAASRLLQRDMITAFLSSPTAAFGRWVGMISASLATVLLIPITLAAVPSRSKSFPRPNLCSRAASHPGQVSNSWQAVLWAEPTICWPARIFKNPPSQWTPVWTNSIYTRGADNFSVTISNTIASGAGQFYILQSR